MKDKVEKNGGNVVSYFCTSDLRVLHFVVGPVSADRLFAEAAWVHRVYDEVRYRGIDELTEDQAEKLARRQTDAVRREHLAMVGDRADAFVREFAASVAAHDKSRGGAYLRPASYGAKSTKKPAAERWSSLVWRVGGNDEQRPHRLLALDPLPPLAEVDSTIFRQLAGERVNDRDGSVERALAKVKRAERDGRPTMFVFHREWFGGSASYDRNAYADATHRKLLRQFNVVRLPLKELPALSARLPDFALPVVAEETGVQFVFADCRQRQISAISGLRSADAFASVLHHAIARNQIALAERLIEQDRRTEAKRVLYRARRSTDRDTALHASALLATLLAE
ncbi:MAG: hypothetical protein DCC68_00580 [Planctomycetota bacterium]|nr:MAG: hypothetical protein DCC68_00580 [Planctomycetota bacterium]